MRENMKRAIIIGATSGIGKEVALLFIRQGWRIGIAGRREKELKKLQSEAPSQVEIQVLDVTQSDAEKYLTSLIERTGGMDLFLLSSGIGFQNRNLISEIELDTARTNVEGFIRMTTAAFNYFKKKLREKSEKDAYAHIAVISSIAGTKGLGVAPAYSATKRFQNTYIEALAQQAHMEELKIYFTDIRPGFVATDLLKSGTFPILMSAKSTARHIMRALSRKKRVAVIDGRYRLWVFFWKLIPRFLWERISVSN